MRDFTAILFALTMATTPCAAQLGKPLPNPAFPQGAYTFDVQLELFRATGVEQCAVLGVARSVTGHYWVTARRAPVLPTTNQHMLFEFDSQGAYVNSYPQPQSDESAWGIRDLAFDGFRYLYGGHEADRVFAFDTLTRTWDMTQDFAVPSTLKFRTVRALAYDPNGDAGRGSLWTASWSSDHVEFDRAGNVLNTVPNLQLETYGAAYDPVRRSIWWFGQAGGRTLDDALVGTEMSLATLSAAGPQLLGDLGVSGLRPGGFAGGVELYDDGTGRVAMLLLSQADSDTVYEIWGRFGFGPTTGGEVSFDGGPAYVGNASWGVTLEGSSAPLAALLIGFAETSIVLTPPLFQPGSTLLLQHVSVLPTMSVIGGAARQPIPVPANFQLAGNDVYFQWIEFATNGTNVMTPVALSNGGKVRIHP